MDHLRWKTARSDPRVKIRGRKIRKVPADQFFNLVAREVADSGQIDKDNFVLINDIARRLEDEGHDERLRKAWASTLSEAAKQLLSNSKQANETWEELAHAMATVEQ